MDDVQADIKAVLVETRGVDDTSGTRCENAAAILSPFPVADRNNIVIVKDTIVQSLRQLTSQYLLLGEERQQRILFFRIQ
jgi:hypothetical protein